MSGHDGAGCDCEAGRGLDRRRVIALLAGSAAATLMPGAAWAAPARARAGAAAALPADEQRLFSLLHPERALNHIVKLSEGIGPRIGGTDSEAEAAEYLAERLDRWGYDTRMQPFPVADKFLGELERRGGTPLPQDICWQVGASPEGALDTVVRGETVDAGDGAPGSYPADVTGKILLVDYVASARNTVVATAVARGAAAVVFLAADLVFPRRAGAFTPRLTTPVAIPVLGAAQVQKERLRALVAGGPLDLRVRTEAHRGLTSRNVLAERAGDPAAPVVMVCAHYDSVIGAKGANDDGSGTALTMELAQTLRKLPTDATIQFGLWGSEEQGLIGSRYYVAGLSPAQRQRYLAVFNNDMVATSWDQATMYWVLSANGQANAATSAVIAAAGRLGYSQMLSSVTMRGSSDHQSFQDVGIASGNFTWRAEASPALLEPPYHTPEDTVALNVSLDRLKLSLEFIGSAMYATAGPAA
ncbi:M28 family peptidase [Motilibacter aurantiacus]|uniref:M28 family peptidase n=1 Tax=Motilibacter aurantiacus TaxID=2714955 RepID=UPI00140B14B0|nr:M28 family peptidase [Motilibacter aurantiacus]NHC43779.1 M28 family peptidase [Motilibacter aurantiacus]